MLDKFIFLIFVVTMMTSCEKKVVELPQIQINGITDIYNHSQIWIFYSLEEEKIKADLNKNNIINTTHWIINIDKKLPMKEVVPVLELIKIKRDKKTPHSIEGLINYVSYSNPKDKNISLFQIDKTHYLVLDQKGYEELLKHYKSDYNLILNERDFIFDSVKYPLSSLNISFFDTLQPRSIHLFFDSDVSYQNYLEKKIMIHEYIKKKLYIDQTEYMLH